jgi:threonine synthase
MPHVSLGGVAQLLEMDYPARAANILSLFLTDFKPEEILAMCKQAYGADRFDDPLIAPLLPVGDSFVLELFHGPTQAFKDMALQMLPHFMRASMKKTETEKETVILVATSAIRARPRWRASATYPEPAWSSSTRRASP